ncbi:MAG: glycerophosphodiester phosphodiesterase family protein [Bacteroidota bacterium]
MNKTSSSNSQASTDRTIDWQGHRGARGLLPENTIPAFIKALEYPQVTTLELDLAVSKDSQLIVSHEPWMSAGICSKPDGSPVTKKEEKSLRLYEMTYEEIKTYDCGSRGNKRFPDQQPMQVYKPSFMDMVSNVELHCQKNKLPRPKYNIEIKSEPEGYGTMVPHPERFVQLVLDEIDLLNIKDRVNLQSFDINVLREIKKQDSTMVIAHLVENIKGFEANVRKLGFEADIYSPHYGLLNKSQIKKIHERGMLIIPWTVNDPKTMAKLIEKGVDGIITDYPNMIEEALK